MKFNYKFSLVLLVAFIFQISVDGQSNKTFFLGHSLVNFNIPNMVNKLSIAASDNFTYNANIGNGANLFWHYTNPASGQGDQWNLTLNQSGFENLIITEAVPLMNHLVWSNTYRYTDSLYQFASQYSPDVQYYIYETWHCINSGTPTGCSYDDNDGETWRDRLTLDLPLWEGIADSMNLLYDKEMLIIPGGQALAKLYDRIEDGLFPGVTTIDELFDDDIHLTNTGNYYIACLMYAIIHKKSPVGLPNQLTNEWGGLYTEYPTPEQALAFQNLVWETVSEYERDGVLGTPLSVSEIDADTKILSTSQVEISWEMVVDNTCSHFFIERSNDAENFNVISEDISLNTTHNYAFIDHDAPNGILYYRINLVDCDANKKSIKTLKVDKTGLHNIVLPYNMINDRLQFTALTDLTDNDITLVSADGSIIAQHHFKHLTFGATYSIDVSSFVNGLYFMVFNNKYSKPQNLKFVKIN